MKQRSKILLALLLSASVATTPIASVSVFAEDLDFVAVEDNTDTSAEDDFDSEETSVIAEDNTEADDFASEETNLFSAGEGDTIADATDQADATEAKTHSIKVTVVNSSGSVSGMYAMDNAVVTRQENGTYLVHTLNNTVLASPRGLIAFLENNVNEDGSVNIPVALRPYMGGKEKVFPKK